MIDTRARSPIIVLAIGFVFLAGCNNEPKMAEVSGLITVNGEIPMDGSSISFVPLDGKSPTAGGVLKQGKYTVNVPLGTSRVEIRVPRISSKPKAGSGGSTHGEQIEESLPPEYNSKSTLTLEVKPGKNEKNWELQTKK